MCVFVCECLCASDVCERVKCVCASDVCKCVCVFGRVCVRVCE